MAGQLQVGQNLLGWIYVALCCLVYFLIYKSIEKEFKLQEEICEARFVSKNVIICPDFLFFQTNSWFI